MNKFTLIVMAAVCVLIPTAMSLKCYTCNNPFGNCGEMAMPCKKDEDVCFKHRTGDSTTKSCGKKSDCDARIKSCTDNNNYCEAACCETDECNAGAVNQPVVLVTALAAFVAAGALH
ncbi:CD59 glycoprotein [Nematostella vectensis]|uniref:CD59 glycoprotein n=1 Tax=Nematostella vectensis TaxID=45351 RepID=UPI002077850B|nr:CD59 glycoprotein [Nematostella vectensis]